MNPITEQDIAHALEVLSLTPPITSEDLERARRVQLYNWNPSRYAGLTNNPTRYMEQYRKAEEMTDLVEASYVVLSTILLPDDDSGSS